MKQQNISGIQGVDTRELTKKIRATGTMLGRIVNNLPIPETMSIDDPNKRNLVAEVSIMVRHENLIFIKIIFLNEMIDFPVNINNDLCL